ncbi:F0F1 ATP synthase subunit delta [Zavarzinella formosa]|uniref:F0F1 ATP synthase subunit delta n=1 Tax=Zavarzinella formosa TaxID=360055 RepID=UPI000316F15A|nr:hypothetical protein [Zavarzinella formosa]
MLIDWFTVGAQALNFLLLVWLMRRFLYKPVLNAIDAREKLIAAELADAVAKKADAQKERDEFQKKNQEFDRQRVSLLDKATTEATAERQRLLDEARNAADSLRARQQDALNRDQQSLHDEITRRTREEVFAIARKTLTDLSGTNLEERICDVFTRRLRELNGEAKDGLAKAVRASRGPIPVRSEFDLPAKQREMIQKALNETLSADIPLRFETAPALIGGIELTTNGQKVAWSIAEYLALMDASIGELLKKGAKPRDTPEIKPGAKPKPETRPDTAKEPV